MTPIPARAPADLAGRACDCDDPDPDPGETIEPRTCRACGGPVMGGD
jgi:hypothetical protein